MFMFPLPFLTACLLAVLFGYSLILRLPALVHLALAGYVLQAILIGVKWGLYDLRPLPVIVLASLLPLLTWAALTELSGKLGARARQIVLAGALGLVALVAGLALAGQGDALDLLSTAQYVIFGTLLVAQAFRTAPKWVAIDAAAMPVSAELAFLLGGMLLLGSATIDIAFFTQMALAKGHIGSVVVGYTNFLAALITSAVVFWGLHGRNEPEAVFAPLAAEAEAPGEDDPDLRQAAEILDRLDRLMRQTHLYRDENLTLHRLASHSDTRARQISTAVRTLRQMGVPQYVNSFRVSDACRMLAETDMPVTEIVFAVGFTTKSSFNREFSRCHGLSPSAWRAQYRKGPMAEPDRGPMACDAMC